MKRTKEDILVSNLVRAKADWTCERCGWAADPTKSKERQKLQCSHVKSRKYNSLRFSMLNCFCLCAKCHAALGDFPIEHSEWVKSHVGPDAHLDLLFHGAVDKVFLRGEKAAMYAYYKKELEHVEKARAQGVKGRVTVLDWETNGLENWIATLEDV